MKIFEIRNFKKLQLSLILFLFIIPVFCQNLKQEDFYVIVNQTKIELGDSLEQYDSTCKTKDFQTIKLGNMKYNVFNYSWGQIYTSYYSKDYTIFGIIITDKAIKILKNITLGTSKQDVTKTIRKSYI